MSSAITSFLESNSIGDLKKQLSGLISLPPDATIESALKLLANRGITATAVYDLKIHKFLGFVDILDLSVFIVMVFKEHFEKHPHLYQPRELEQRFQLPISEVMNASNRDVFYPVDVGENLSFLIDNFLQYGVHRVPVTQKGDVKGIITQSDVIRFLHSHREELSALLAKPLSELGLVKGSPITVRNDEPLMKAFTTILANNISGLAVVNAKGELVNNISASDLKGVTKESFFRLEAAIHEVLLYSPRKLPPVACNPHTTLGEVIERIESTGVHRIFVVDEGNHPLSVVTLTDILRVFANPAQYIP